MNRLVFATLSVLSFAAAQPAPAQTAPAVQAQSAQGSPKLICRSTEAMGSRLQKNKRCLTADQWRQVSRDQADDVDRRLRAPHQEAGGG